MTYLGVENKTGQNWIYIHLSVCYVPNTEIRKMNKAESMSQSSDSIVNLNMATISWAPLSTS